MTEALTQWANDNGVTIIENIVFGGDIYLCMRLQEAPGYAVERRFSPVEYMRPSLAKRLLNEMKRDLMKQYRGDEDGCKVTM